jgi:hypothetical protein
MLKAWSFGGCLREVQRDSKGKAFGEREKKAGLRENI